MRCYMGSDGDSYPQYTLYDLEEIMDVKYDTSKYVEIKILKQATLYIKNGAKLVDVYVKNNIVDELIFVFEKADTQELYYKWKNKELR